MLRLYYKVKATKDVLKRVNVRMLNNLSQRVLQARMDLELVQNSLQQFPARLDLCKKVPMQRSPL
jgi:hypothetical protein